MIDTDATGLLFDSLRADALTSPDQLRELYPQPNPSALRKETDGPPGFVSVLDEQTQLNVPGLTLDQIEEAEQESLRVR
ncbi:hypothetical protein [Streptomyces salinarius]|uniref:hypothetical protein n=1 Tax=Streptomyces salinarius TaxID=2762598 RepID=UPI0021BDB89F|nr:hypothetical protein [Streptomyces salinarius]